MAGKVDNLILKHLKAMRADIDSLKNDTNEIKSQLTSVESGIAGLRRDSASQHMVLRTKISPTWR